MEESGIVKEIISVVIGRVWAKRYLVNLRPGRLEVVKILLRCDGGGGRRRDDGEGTGLEG